MHTNTDTERKGHGVTHQLRRNRRRFTAAEAVEPTQTAREWADEIHANERPDWYPGESDYERALRLLGIAPPEDLG